MNISELLKNLENYFDKSTQALEKLATEQRKAYKLIYVLRKQAPQSPQEAESKK